MSDLTSYGLCRRAGMEPPLWRDDELSFDFPKDRERLLASGVIVATNPATVADCPDCENGTIGRVRPLRIGAGPTLLRLACPECGLVAIEESSLRRWLLDLRAFAAAVARALGVRGLTEPFAEERGWFLGRATWCQRLHEVFLVRALHSAILPDLLARLERHPKAIILAATAEDASLLRTSGPQLVLPLHDVLRFDGDITCVPDVIESALVGNSPPSSTRPVKRRSGLLAKIDRIKAELIAHIRAARDHAHDAEDRTCEPALLARPTKSKLAEMAGLKPHDVTRCFKDQAGRELCLLWEVAGNLEEILRYAK